MRDVIEKRGRRLGVASLFAVAAASVTAAAISYNAFYGQTGHGFAALREGATTRLAVDAEAAESATVRLRYDPVVEQVQRELQAAGFYRGAIDGVAGRRTRLAIEAYQKATDLSITGEPSPGLIEHIRFTRQVAEASLFTGTVEPDAGAEDRARIRRVQTGLAELAYLPGEINGEMTETTRSAILRFERDRGLAETGEISGELLAELAKMSGQSEITAGP